MNRKKTEKILSFFIFIVLLTICALITYLFVMNIYHYNLAEHIYESDFPLHFEGALESGGKGYSLNSFLIYWTYRIFHTKIIFVVGLLGLIIATYIINYYIITLFVNQYKVNISNNAKLLLSMVPLFMTSIYLPHYYEKFYAATYGGALWHNETYFEMRVMSMLVLVIFFRIKEHYIHSFTLKEWSLLTISLTITNAFKPNFVLGFAPVVAILLLKDLINNYKDRKVVKRIIAMGLSVLFSLPILLLQSTRLFNIAVEVEEKHGIGIEIGAFMTSNVYIQLILGFAPVLCIVCYSIYKKDFPKWYCFLLGMALLNFAIKHTFVETGNRYYAGNFGWGLRNSIYLLNLASLLLFIKHSRGLWTSKDRTILEKSIYIISLLVFSASLISGSVYFMNLLQGRLPWGM